MTNYKDLRIVFMGTPGFATGVLKHLVESKCNIVGVVTAADKPAGRGRKLQSSEVACYAESVGLNILKPKNLKDPIFSERIKGLNADICVVVAFRMLPESVWSLRPTFNLHASLLPQYRGAAPINWAIINGEKKTGVTTFFIEKEIDTGKIISHKEVNITDDDNVGTLHDKLMNVGADLVLETLISFANEDIEPKIQNVQEKKLIPAPKIFKEDCQINWEQTTEDIHNFIRGLSPYPTAWTNIKNTCGEDISLKIYDVNAEIIEHKEPAGTLFTDNKTYMKISTCDGYINIKELQLPGRKRLPIKQVLSGYKF
ncbi:MAG: methionyl-tRNA formyltransferase [Bacteroidales bacterium]